MFQNPTGDKHVDDAATAWAETYMFEPNACLDEATQFGASWEKAIVTTSN